MIVNDRLYCVNRFLYCLDLNNNLQELWRLRDSALSDYGSIFASSERVLVVSKGELLLLGTDGSERVISRQKVFAEEEPVYSHPALVGNRLYVRGEARLVAITLEEP